MKKMIVVDSNVYFGESEPQMAGLPSLELGNSDTEKVLEEMSVAGIDRSVLIPPHHTQYGQSNRLIADVVEKHPEKLIGFGRVNPNCVECGFETAREAVEDLGLDGLYVSHFAWLWYDPAIAVPFFRRLLELKVPIMINAGVDRGFVQRSLAEILDYSPRKNIIAVAFFAGLPGDHDYLLGLAATNRNLYVLTSGPNWVCGLDRLVAKIGADRVIFGSSSPVYHPAPQKANVQSMHISEREKNLILGENIIRLLGRKE